ncbi:tetratricopeptide repeat protein [Qipengyuania marisflavi]|uniref:Tetratricopeptide repeat protein n=1 Tax=Qipengyuania marisflavi TaxID=2486356 RepID=A0A5S3P349_9SPHN|nr:tetratricopeptide repeat protein [Qipengyuania marisflavi]
MGVALAVVAAAIGYRALDDREARPVAGGEEPAALTIEDLQRRADAAPDDSVAWQELGFARYERGEFAEAVTAYARATELDPDQAILWSALGEARVMASARDPLPVEALIAFEQALKIDPDDPRAGYFLAVKRDLAGDHEGAIADWLALLAKTPPGAPWESDLARTIEQVGKVNDIPTEARIKAAQEARGGTFAAAAPAPAPTLAAAQGIPGPSADQIAAARTMSPGQQREMAEGMVASLESKLKANPANVDGWAMLMRSRATLGQTDLARKALADALAANPGAAQRLRSEAEVLGIR